MKIAVFLFTTLIICLGCDQPENSPSQTSINPDFDQKENTDPVEMVKNPFDDSLQLYFESPVDFYALKKKTQHMLDGGKRDMPESCFHPTDHPDAIFEWKD